MSRPTTAWSIMSDQLRGSPSRSTAAATPEAGSGTSHGPVAAVAGLVLALVLGLLLAVGQPLARSVAAADAAPELPPPVGSPSPTGSSSPAPFPSGFELFWEALGIVREHYVGGEALTDQNLTRGAIRGMVEALGDDGHTVYLTPEEVQAEIDALDGRVIGIGVSVDSRRGAPVIIAVYPGSPAAEAGLRPGDIIETVDGRRVDRIDVPELIDRVRGEPGTVVTLGIERADGTRTELDIVRAEVRIPPVAWSMVPGTSVAVMGVNQFSDGAAREARRATRRALADGATAVVLDLRGNPGGLVHEAVGVARLFLPRGSVVYQEEDRDGTRRAVTTRDDPVAADVPLVVLVDEGSASSAEIVAAALHDNGRARLVGKRTFGTGTVLNLFSLSDGSAIRLGVLRWLTPTGRSAFETGVAPDLPVDLPQTGAMLYPSSLDAMSPRAFRRSQDTQLRRAVRLLTTDPTGTPLPPEPPEATPMPETDAPAASRTPPEPPPSASGDLG